MSPVFSNARTGQLIAKATVLPKHPNRGENRIVSTNGMRVLIGMVEGYHKPGEVVEQVAKVWDLKAGGVDRHLKCLGESEPTAVGFTPDGTIAITKAGSSVYLWEVATERMLASLSHPGRAGQWDAVAEVSFDRRAAKVLTGTRATGLRLWDVSSRTSAPFAEDFGLLNGRLSNDGERIFAWETRAFLWDVALRNPIAAFPTLAGYITQACAKAKGRGSLSKSKTPNSRRTCRVRPCGMSASTRRLHSLRSFVGSKPRPARRSIRRAASARCRTRNGLNGTNRRVGR